jgi:hypothetical protein
VAAKVQETLDGIPVHLAVTTSAEALEDAAGWLLAA